MERKYYSDQLAIAAEKNIKEREYWLNKLSGNWIKTSFPNDYKNKTGGSKNERCYHSLEFAFNGDIFDGLMSITNRSDYALNITLITGLAILLHKYTGSQDLIIGTPIYSQETTGKFINTILPLRMLWAEDISFKELLLQTRQTIDEAAEHQNYPLEFIFDHLKIPFSESDDFPLFDNLILLENVNDKEYIRDVHCNMIFTFTRKEEEIHGCIKYNSLLYEPVTVERMVKHWHHLFRETLSQHHIKISALDLLLPDEKEQLLSRLNHTLGKSPGNMTITGLFEKQAEKNPNQTAVIFEDRLSHNRQVTYRGLNQGANQLAGILKSKGINANKIVGIMLERSTAMIEGILGTLKAGGAYLPIDPDYPGDLILSILNDSNVPILLTGKTALEKKPINRSADEIVMVDTLNEIMPGEGDGNPEQINTPADLAYIIFTSGSTGRPKGVMIDHKNVTQLMVDQGNLFDFSGSDVWTMFHSYTFDFSVWEMYGALLYGGKLVVLEKIVTRDPNRTRESLKKHGVSVLNQTPSAFYGLSEKELNQPGKDLKKLRYIIFGGEALKEGRLKGWKEKYPETRLINMYGITETTVHVTFKEIEPVDIELNKSNIGKPLPTLNTYIMDSDLRLKPIGVPGELFVGGEGLGRGYLNRPQLTSERFISNPFQPGTRLYRSGDLVRLTNNGDMEYLGRVDNQIKVRGFRIELGEIESQLLQHSEIKDIVVRLHQRVLEPDQQTDDVEQYICAYWVPNDPLSTLLNTSLLKEYLSEKLPEYMIPSYFVQLDEIPLTSNGKIDSSRLPEPGGQIETGVKYEPPANEIEKKLVEIWRDILMTDKIGVNDNFIDIGGDSIKAIQIEARLNHEGYKIEIADLFLSPTIRGMAPLVKKVEHSIDQSPVEGKVELTPIQHWFFENDYTDKHHYNQSVMIYSKTGFEKEIVSKVFTRLVEHHDALRMVFKIDKEPIVQENRGINIDYGNFFDLRVVNLDSQNADASYIKKEIEKTANRIQASINLNDGPLVKLGLFKTNNGDHLLMVIHHLVVDGVSWRILLEDFRAGYQQAVVGEEIKFPEKTNSYQDWAQKLIQYAESIEILKELDYWTEIVNADPGPLPVQHQVEKEKNILRNREIIHMMLTRKETQLLMKEVNKAYNTEINDILLTALAAAVGQWANRERVLINLEGHGREAIIEGINITRTLGWFTAQFPVLLDTYKDKSLSWGEQVKKTKETLRGIPQKGIGYGIIKYLLAGKKQLDFDFHLQPTISFNYLGGFGQEISGGDQGAFGISEMNMGEPVSPELEMTHAIDINGIVLDGNLQISFIYNKFQFNRDTMVDLLREFKTNLVQIIEQCSQMTQTQLTKSDFSSHDYDDEEVETMYEVLEEAFEN